MFGYNGKILEVDLTREKIEEIKLEEEVLKRFIGGRGLAVKILWDRLGNKWEEIDPLGLENIFLALTGPLTGYYPGARVCISGKSPQSNGIVGSTIGGEFALELKCAGWDGIIVTGRASSPVYIFIKDDNVEIRDSSHIWGLDGKKTVMKINKEVREELSKLWPRVGLWGEPGLIYIGPAGENKVRISAVMSKWTHGAGYGGYGAVMGSKNLKAIAVKGTKPLPPVADRNRVLELMDKVAKLSYANDEWRRWGTGYGGYSYGADTSSEPIRNWQEEWHDNVEYGVDKFERRLWVKRYWADYGCPTSCLKIAVVKSGAVKGAITDNPDYELQAYLGTNLGVFTPEGNVYISSAIDDLGLCGIQCGNVLGFAGELYQRGILTEKDLNGLKLEWGNPKVFVKLAEDIARRKGIGNVLAEGTYRAALILGRIKNMNLLSYAIQSKGIAIGAHGVRSGLDYPQQVSYACSVQGGDHTSIAGLPLDGPLWNTELSMIAADSGVVCAFNVWSLSLLFEFMNSVTGWNISRNQWYEEIALRILQIQRATLLLGGPDIYWSPIVDDDNPERFYEPLPSGPSRGKSLNRENTRKAVREYYEAIGWDEYGIPKSEILKKLDLEDVDKALNKVRSRMKSIS
ncbi:MAG: aldehyde ferredoxin oxidoreductase C-terminal domain-containing protein [Candidatus Methanomethylicia archaeon]